MLPLLATPSREAGRALEPNRALLAQLDGLPASLPTGRVTPAVRHVNLLAQHNVSNTDLLFMTTQAYLNTYRPENTGSWKGVQTAEVSGAILPAAIFENVHTGKRIAAFSGMNISIDTAPALPGQSVPLSIPGAQACIAAKYSFPGTNAASAWEKTCDKYGNEQDKALTLSAVASQLSALLSREPNISFLTGVRFSACHDTLLTTMHRHRHSLGCTAALSLGHIHGLPVICWQSSASFSTEWVAGYPGLAEALESNPYPENQFSMQLYTDPLSTCLRPTFEDDSTHRRWASAACIYGVWASCDEFTAAQEFMAYDNLCVQKLHQTDLTVNFAYNSFYVGECTDFCHSNIRVCPYLPAETSGAFCSAEYIATNRSDHIPNPPLIVSDK